MSKAHIAVLVMLCLSHVKPEIVELKGSLPSYTKFSSSIANPLTFKVTDKDLLSFSNMIFSLRQSALLTVAVSYLNIASIDSNGQILNAETVFNDLHKSIAFKAVSIADYRVIQTNQMFITFFVSEQTDFELQLLFTNDQFGSGIADSKLNSSLGYGINNGSTAFLIMYFDYQTIPKQKTTQYLIFNTETLANLHTFQYRMIPASEFGDKSSILDYFADEELITYKRYIKFGLFNNCYIILKKQADKLQILGNFVFSPLDYDSIPSQLDFNVVPGYYIIVPAKYSGSFEFIKYSKNLKNGRYIASLISESQSDYIKAGDADLIIINNDSLSPKYLRAADNEATFNCQLINELDKDFILQIVYNDDNSYPDIQDSFPVQMLYFTSIENTIQFRILMFNNYVSSKIRILANNGYLTNVKYSISSYLGSESLVLGQTFSQSKYFVLPINVIKSSNSMILLEVGFVKTKKTKMPDVEVFYLHSLETQFTNIGNGLILNKDFTTPILLINKRLKDKVIYGVYSANALMISLDNNISNKVEYDQTVFEVDNSHSDLVAISAKNASKVTTVISISYVSKDYVYSEPSRRDFSAIITQIESDYSLLIIKGFAPFQEGSKLSKVTYYLIADIYEEIPSYDKGYYNTMFLPTKSQLITHDSLQLKIKSDVTYYVRLIAYDEYSNIYFAYDFQMLNSSDFFIKKRHHHNTALSIVLISVSVVLIVSILTILLTKVLKSKRKTAAIL